MRLCFRPAGERAPLGRPVSKSSTRNNNSCLGIAGTCQRGTLVSTSCVSREQERAIGVDDSPEMVVVGAVSGKPRSLFVTKC
jgi:hypothetical protein